MGERINKLSSAIYYDGPNFGPDRFQNLTIGKDKKMYKKAMLRKKWVNFLREHTLPNEQWTEEAMEELFTWAKNTKIEDL